MYDLPIPKPAMDDYEEIARIVRAGQAPNVFSLGDQIEVMYNGTYKYPFRVVHFEEVELESGSTVPGMIVQAVYATHDDVVFNTSSSNRWATSSGRTWLQDTFKSRITPSFVDILKPVKIETLRNYADSDTKPAGSGGRIYDTTYDMFFAATTTNIGGGVHSSYDPTYGVIWSYWEANNNNAARITRDVTAAGTARNVWLRSAYRSTANREYFVSTVGNRAGSDYNYQKLRWAPACVIC